MANSKEQLLRRMSERPVTEGWGAVAVYSRSRLNHLLEQQYNERLDTMRFLPSFSQSLASPAPAEHRIKLEKINFGTPRLSFSNASLSNSRALLTLAVVGGRCTTFDQANGVLLSTFSVTEAMGFYLEMEIDLEHVAGEVNRRGRVTLDLTKGARMACNLLAEQPVLNEALVTALHAWFQGLPGRVSAFDLGMIDFDGYDPLSPASFVLRTQAAPGARIPGSTNHGDGAVLVFIRVLGDSQNGAFPGEDFPYLIPDGDYSATLVLAQRLLEQVRDGHLEVLSSLLFPGSHAFIEKERKTPLDLVVFGNIDPLLTTYRIEPAGVVIEAGQRQQFTLHDGAGKPVTASRWRAVSLSSHTVQGHGEIDSRSGLYTSPARNAIGRESMAVVITAEVDSDVTNRPYVASLRALVTFEALTLCPQVASFAPSQQEAIALSGWSADAAPVSWELIEPRHGELAELDGQKAVFVPTPRDAQRSLVAQQVRAQGTAEATTALLLVNGQQLLTVDPPYAAHVQRGNSLQLADDGRFLDAIPRRWRMLAGDGQVDERGLFMSADQSASQSNVAVCELIHNGVVYASGYSVVNQSEMAQEASWNLLSVFNVRVLGGADNGRLGRLYANGYQQLELEVYIETAPNGQDYPLSVEERASLNLMLVRGPEHVPFLDEQQEGIEPSDETPWAVRLTGNRFDMANANTAHSERSQLLNDRQWTTSLFLHSRTSVGQSRELYARIQSDSGEWHSSNDTSDPRATVEVTAAELPRQGAEDYSFERIRVAGGSRNPGDPEEDDFDFHLRTVDYWTLKYRYADFVSCEFVAVENNQVQPAKLTNLSMIRWESEYVGESMFSYTGSIFHNRQRGYPQYVTFDASLPALSQRQKWGENDLEVGATGFETGALVIVNVRVDDMPYHPVGDPNRDFVSKPVVVLLHDSKGNSHYRRIDYLPRNTPSNRNYLTQLRVEPTLVEPGRTLTVALDLKY